MAVAFNGEVEIYYEQFGDEADPTLLLVNGLGSQCINFDVEWCKLFVAEGFQVVRFDNRDIGLSSTLDGVRYGLVDMAADALAVLDTLGVERAHVMGLSMGGMIVQRLAINHPDRVVTLTSVMSTTGESDVGRTSSAAMKLLLARAPRSRSEYVDLHMAALDVYGSQPEWIDREATRTRLGKAFDRAFNPKGIARQMAAVSADGSRADGLRALDVPALVMHGSRDTLIDPSGGRRTAELLPGARYVEIEGLGHDYPPAVWPQWVQTWADFVHDHARAA